MLTCRHFPACGGCTTLGQTPARQLAAKAAQARAVLAPFLGAVELEYEVPATEPRFYRTRLLYPALPDVNGVLTMGLHRRGTHELVPIRDCQTQDPGLTELGVRAERALRDLGLTPWNERTRTGTVRALLARLAAGTGELLVTLVTRPGLLPEQRALAEELAGAARELPHLGRQPTRLVGIVRGLDHRQGNFVLGDQHVPLRGRDAIEDRQDGLVFRLSAGSFWQAHRDAATLLYRPAMALLGDVRGLRVTDAYGGVGAFALRLARHGAQVTLVESHPAACRDAVHNAKVNGLTLEVVKGRFAEAAGPKADLLVVDPPRAGLGADGVAQALALAPARILHVACSLTSLARDLGGLVSHGYQVARARLCDLFPHTDHTEAVVLLERVSAPK